MILRMSSPRLLFLALLAGALATFPATARGSAAGGGRYGRALAR